MEIKFAIPEQVEIKLCMRINMGLTSCPLVRTNQLKVTLCIPPTAVNWKTQLVIGRGAFI